jgi:hypothetical protein
VPSSNFLYVRIVNDTLRWFLAGHRPSLLSSQACLGRLPSGGCGWARNARPAGRVRPTLSHFPVSWRLYGRDVRNPADVSTSSASRVVRRSHGTTHPVHRRHRYAPRTRRPASAEGRSRRKVARPARLQVWGWHRACDRRPGRRRGGQEQPPVTGGITGGARGVRFSRRLEPHGEPRRARRVRLLRVQAGPGAGRGTKEPGRVARRPSGGPVRQAGNAVGTAVSANVGSIARTPRQRRRKPHGVPTGLPSGQSTGPIRRSRR